MTVFALVFGFLLASTEIADRLNSQIVEVSEKGGGVVSVPAGEWSLSGPIRFRSNVELRLADDAVLEFSDDPQDYLPPVPAAHTGIEIMGYSPLVYAYCCTNVALTGRGLLRPRMDVWRKWMRGGSADVARCCEALYYWCSTNAPLPIRDMTAFPGVSFARPHLLLFNRCKGVRIDGVRIHQSPCWTLHTYLCDDVVVRNVDICAYGNNNDAIDIEMSSNVLIEDSRILCGDDGICLKAGRNADGWRLGKPTENVTIRRCHIASSHSVLAIGSELSAGIRNVLCEDCSADSVRSVFCIKTNPRRGGFVNNVIVRNVEAQSVDSVFQMRFDGFRWKFPDFELRDTDVANILLENIRVKDARDDFLVQERPSNPPKNVTVRNVSIERKGTQRRGVLTDRLDRAHLYAGISPGFAKALDFLARPDLYDLPLGEYEIDGKTVVAEVQDVCLRDPEDYVCERHHDHAEIIMTFGKDKCGGRGSREVIGFGAKQDWAPILPFTVICEDLFMIAFPGAEFAPCLSSNGRWVERRIVIRVYDVGKDAVDFVP